MDREESEKAKRVTDDGKLRGIISSARFVSESLEMECNGFGELFRVKTDNDELDEFRPVDKTSRKRKSVVQTGLVLDEPRGTIVVLKIPRGLDDSAGQVKKKRRVRFAE
jgi:hypothetical protein